MNENLWGYMLWYDIPMLWCDIPMLGTYMRFQYYIMVYVVDDMFEMNV